MIKVTKMAPWMAMPAQLTGDFIPAGEGAKWKVLDIAAGHRLYGLAIANNNPNAEIVALDWASVLQVARGECQGSGVVGTLSEEAKALLKLTSEGATTSF